MSKQGEQKYKVNRLYLSGRGNNKFFEGTIIKASQIENIDEKLKDGSIVPYNEKDGETVEVSSATTKVENEAVEATAETPLFTYEKDGATVEVYTEADINKASVIAQLVLKGIEHDQSDKKSILFDLLLASFAE